MAERGEGCGRRVGGVGWGLKGGAECWEEGCLECGDHWGSIVLCFFWARSGSFCFSFGEWRCFGALMEEGDQ